MEILLHYRELSIVVTSIICMLVRFIRHVINPLAIECIMGMKSYLIVDYI